MRLPLSDYVSNKRDERKHILFLGDLFTGTEDLLLTSLVKSLGEEYHCMYEKFPKGPREAVEHISHLCMSDCLRPDLIVACGTAATIACFKSAKHNYGIDTPIDVRALSDAMHARDIGKIKKVLITPYFSTSTMIANMLPLNSSRRALNCPILVSQNISPSHAKCRRNTGRWRTRSTARAYGMLRPCSSVQMLIRPPMLTMSTTSALHTSCQPRTPSRPMPPSVWPSSSGKLSLLNM